MRGALDGDRWRGLLEFDFGVARSVMMSLVMRVAVRLRGIAISAPLADPRAAAIGVNGVAFTPERGEAHGAIQP